MTTSKIVMQVSNCATLSRALHLGERHWDVVLTSVGVQLGAVQVGNNLLDRGDRSVPVDKVD